MIKFITIYNNEKHESWFRIFCKGCPIFIKRKLNQLLERNLLVPGSSDINLAHPNTLYMLIQVWTAKFENCIILFDDIISNEEINSFLYEFGK